MKVLVTGGLGFIGSHMVDACLERNYDVTVIDDLSTGCMSNSENFKGRVKIVEGSIIDKVSLNTIFPSPHPYDIIFHLAALPNVGRSIDNPVETAWVNIMGTVNILERSDSTKVVLASSSSVYGGGLTNKPMKESMRLNPLSPYAAQKIAVENLSEQYCKHDGDDITCLRFFNVYGPRQRSDSPYAGVIPRFFDAKKQGKPAIIDGDGLQSRDFTYVKDAVFAMLTAADKASGYHIYNVARGEETSILELHKTIGCSIPPIHTDARIGDVRRSLANVEKIKKDLGWSAKYTLSEGLKLFCPK